MTTNVIDFTDYCNRTAIEDLICEAEENGDDIARETALVLLAMYNEGFLNVSYTDDDELLFVLKEDITEEQLQLAEENFMLLDYINEEML